MRVMVVGPLGLDDFADNVRDTLVRMGHEVLAVGGARPPSTFPKLDTLVSLVSDHTTIVEVRALIAPDMLVEIEADACTGAP